MALENNQQVRLWHYNFNLSIITLKYLSSMHGSKNMVQFFLNAVKTTTKKISRQYYFSNVLCRMHCFPGYFPNRLLKCFGVFFLTWRKVKDNAFRKYTKMINVQFNAVITKWTHPCSPSRAINKRLPVSPKECGALSLSLSLSLSVFLSSCLSFPERESKYGKMFILGESRWMVYGYSLTFW